MRITLEPSSEPSRSHTPKDEVEWLPLPKHPLFSATPHGVSGAAILRNLLAWDGASCLYFWDSSNSSLHRLSLRLGDPDPTSVLAASPSKVLQADVALNFDVRKISINRDGTAILFFGSETLCVMYLYRCTSKKDVNLICRTITVGSQMYSTTSNDIHALQALWHPYSDTHLGILSSDSVFRLFNLAVDPLQPEQEYYLQRVVPGRSRNASSVCPVDFSFGGDHLWDRFSVFVLFSDGTIYVICPVVPFGSLFKCESLLEIYNDAHTFGVVSSNSVAGSNSKLAISWLEATFPGLQNQETEGDNLSLLRAQAYALFDASLVLQGPLLRVGQDGNGDSVGRSAECEGRAVSFLYNLVSKDSILVTAWSGGQLQIDALADETQPLWSVDSPPHLRVDSHDQLLGLAMICESFANSRLEKLDHNGWLGNPPPLLRLATVDLALPRRTESGYNISLFIDTLMPERIYSLHDGGIDSIVLHFLPFTSQTNGKDDIMRTPSVHPVVNTCQSGSTSESSLCGFVSLSDSFGYSWIVAITLSQECVELEMKTWNLLLPVSIDMEKTSISSEGESKERDIPTIISKELLSGPKEVLVPQASPSLHSVAADSIEGRSTLHQYSKLFHETYVEYAHKVYLELKHHAPQLKKIINDQHYRLGDAQQKLLKVEEKESILRKRIDRAIQMHNSLKERLQQLRNLPCAHKKPLSRAERQFKSELGTAQETLQQRLAREKEEAKAKCTTRQTRKLTGICADGCIKIPGVENVPYPTISFVDAWKSRWLLQPKDIEAFVKIMMAKGDVFEEVGPIGCSTLIKAPTKIHIAPDRELANLRPFNMNKDKEPFVYKKPRPQPFPKHNLLDTTSIWAVGMSNQNRARLMSFSPSERDEWHAFRYLQDHHLHMWKLSSSSGLSEEDRRATPTVRGWLPCLQPIDRLYMRWPNWQVVSDQPLYLFHYFILSPLLSSYIKLPFYSWTFHLLPLPRHHHIVPPFSLWYFFGFLRTCFDRYSLGTYPLLITPFTWLPCGQVEFSDKLTAPPSPPLDRHPSYPLVPLYTHPPPPKRLYSPLKLTSSTLTTPPPLPPCPPWPHSPTQASFNLAIQAKQPCPLTQVSSVESRLGQLGAQVLSLTRAHEEQRQMLEWQQRELEAQREERRQDRALLQSILEQLLNRR